MSVVSSSSRVLSGMRPTGQLHLGHYHGVLKNWVKLQHEHACYFFVADWHALTTAYEDPRIIEKSVYGMVVDWLAAGQGPRTRAELRAMETAASRASQGDLEPHAAEHLARYTRCSPDQRRAIDALLEAILHPGFRAWLKVGEYINELATVFDREKK